MYSFIIGNCNSTRKKGIKYRCIEYNKCHYGGMYNVYVKEFLLSMDTTSVVVLLCIKRIFVIT